MARTTVTTAAKINIMIIVKKKKAEPIPGAGHGGPEGCEMSRLPHILDNWVPDGGEVVSLTCQPPFTPRKIPGTHFC
jgi:hypothetical protein